MLVEAKATAQNDLTTIEIPPAPTRTDTEVNTNRRSDRGLYGVTRKGIDGMTTVVDEIMAADFPGR